MLLFTAPDGLIFSSSYPYSMNDRPLAPILITAGPTYEAIDAVRFIGNRSSGRMGIAIAQAAVNAGYQTTLLLGPNCIQPITHDLLTIKHFRSTHDLQTFLEKHWPDQAGTLIMAAAVADFTLDSDEKNNPSKIKRSEEGITLHLKPTPDLIAECALRKQPNQRIIGFALEPGDQLIERATQKLIRKNIDAIIANPLQTMDDENVSAQLITKSNQSLTPGPTTKQNFANWLIEQLPTI